MARLFKVTIVAALLCLRTTTAYTGTLDVPLTGQEQTNWCWNSSSQMLLQYRGHAVAQNDIAGWAVGGHNVGNTLTGTTIAFSISWPFIYTKHGCAEVLKHFGPVSTTFLNRSLTMDELKSEIDASSPAMLAIRWLKTKGNKVTDVGGHAIVLRGYYGALLYLNDPWPSNNAPTAGNSGVQYVVDYAALFNSGTSYTGSANVGNRWSETLKTGRTLDICFLIDSTGSMQDDITAVKGAANGLLDDLSANYTDVRIAVVEYRDYPADPYGWPTDYITRVRTPFTRDLTSVRSAINNIYASGGKDESEAVFSALMRTLLGSEIGGWRPNAERRIVLMGDAPGHNPEPFPGGFSYNDVASSITAMQNPVAIHVLYIGGSEEAQQQFQALAALSAGSTRQAATAIDVPAAVAGLIDEFTETPRFPRGETAAFVPTFTFQPPTESMLPPISTYMIELQRYDTKSGSWKNYKKTTLPGYVTTWIPKKPLPLGDYRWRLGYVRKAGLFTLPSGATETIKGASVVEQDWTTFTRAVVTPGDPVLLTPESFFTATGKTVTYRFATAVNADAYAMEIWKLGAGKPFKKRTVRAPKMNPGATVLEVAVGNHVPGASYSWRVQGLNYDSPKPLIDAWGSRARMTATARPN